MSQYLRLTVFALLSLAIVALSPHVKIAAQSLPAVLPSIPDPVPLNSTQPRRPSSQSIHQHPLRTQPRVCGNTPSSAIRSNRRAGCGRTCHLLQCLVSAPERRPHPIGCGADA